MMTRTLEGHRESGLLQTGMLDLSGERKDPPAPKELPSWNAEALVDALRAIVPDLNWRSVAESLDEAVCNVSGFAALLFILRIYRRASKVRHDLLCFTNIYMRSTFYL